MPHTQRRLRRRETGDRHAVRRHADVVEADLVEEMHRRGVAPVLAADPELQVRPSAAAALHADGDELADPVDVDRREWVALENLLLLIDPQELADIVAREAEGELREVVRAEGEE